MKLTYLPKGYQVYKDKSDAYLHFVIERQLLDESLWKKFVEVFRTREDIADDGWRGEYFGKMMRGACLSYRYAPDPKLYAVLERTVRDLIATADEDGRISTYTPDHEFCGWDLWCRKYVLVGCLYFYDICAEGALKEKILAAMTRHLDYIAERIGEGKTSITDTSNWYGGMNSSSILEPVVEMLKLTKEPRYRTLAEHIIKEGGCKQGSVTDAVEKGVLPHELPTTKAYETTSFFEGILAYYELTREARYLDLAEKFADLVLRNEITIIGCAGCRNEHFDHAAITQTKEVKDLTIMQETCVTVTWMRFLERLLRVTGKASYADEIERSALNAMHGAINLYGEEQYCKEEKKRLPGVPFDSYSPLVGQPRGIGIGGYKKFSSGGYYGCCACIGAAGVALYPLASVMKGEGEAVVLFYHEGEIEIPFDGESLVLSAQGSLVKGRMEYKVMKAPAAEIALRFRVPAWSVGAQALIGGEAIPVAEGYFTIRRVWQVGDKVEITLPLRLVTHLLDLKVAYTYGPFVLARDEQKESIKGKIAPGGAYPSYQLLDPQDPEEIRLLLHTPKEDVLLTDYASCGKHWTKKNARVTVWQKYR